MLNVTEEFVINAEELRYTYNDRQYAVDGASFGVRKGEIFGFLGRNGAGKTTTIKVLTTLVKPTSGKVEVLGTDVRTGGKELRRRIGVVLQDDSFDFTTVEKALDIYGALWGIGREQRKSRTEELLDFFELKEERRKRLWDLSGGQRRRVQVAREFMHDMELLFLDEPTVGLDTVTRRKILDMVKGRAAEGLTVFFTTHNLEEADYICDRVAIIDRGRILADDTVSMLKRTLEVTASKVDSVRQQGVDTSTLDAEIDDMKKLLESRRYREIIEKGLRIEQIMDELQSDSKRAGEKAAVLEQKLNSYEEIGVQVRECREMAAGIAEAMSAGKPTEALALIAACDRKAEEAINSTCLSTLNALERAGRAADEIGLEFRQGITEQSKEAMMEGRLFDSLSLSFNGLKDLSFVILETLQAAFNRGLEGIDYPAALRTAAMNRLDELISDQRYDEAMAYLREVREQASRKAATAAALAPLQSEYQSLSQILRGAGINMRAYESKFNALFSDMPENAPATAAQLIDDMKKLRNSMLPSFSVEEIRGSASPMIAVRNRGRAVALGVSIEVKGQSFSMNDEVGNMKPGQERHLNISPSATGDVKVSVKARSLVDSEEHVYSRLFRVEGSSIVRVRICAHCRGRLREGVQTYNCNCGREYHIPCSSRLKACECGLPIGA